jgi:hypothetical protein
VVLFSVYLVPLGTLVYRFLFGTPMVDLDYRFLGMGMALGQVWD